MVKYIIKRLLISILILFGVSVIIYTMVRLMPNDYIDNKYAAQLQNGTITQDNIDDFKSLYGLYTPEARLEVTIDGIDGTFTRDVKTANYDYMTEASSQSQDYVSQFVCNASAKRTAFIYRNGETRLALTGDTGNTDFSYRLYTQTYEEKTRDVVDENGQVKKETYYESVTVTLSSGTFFATYKDGKLSITLNPVTGSAKISGVNYHVTTGGEKLGAILGGYFTWLGKLIKGDLGISFKYNRPVGEVISDNMWISFAIAIVATVLQFLIAIPLGISSATHQYSARDYIVTVFTMIGISLPTYFFAAIVIKLFAADLGWFPVNGLISASATYPQTFLGWLTKLGDMIHHLILPIFVSVILSLGGLMRYTRTNTLEVLSADYIRTARAKGLSEKTVIYKHAFRNTLIPLATLLAGILPGLFGGMMITEQVFAIDGIGRLAYNALRDGDVPFVMGYNMFLAILTVIGTLLSDIMYSIVDPRVKLGR